QSMQYWRRYPIYVPWSLVSSAAVLTAPCPRRCTRFFKLTPPCSSFLQVPPHDRGLVDSRIHPGAALSCAWPTAIADRLCPLSSAGQTPPSSMALPRQGVHWACVPISKCFYSRARCYDPSRERLTLPSVFP